MEAGRAGEVSTQTYARNGYGGTIANRGGTAPHKPLLSQICDHCQSPFPTVSPKARFCSTRCKNAHWKQEYKLQRLVTLLVKLYGISEVERLRLTEAVHRYAARFFRFAAWLGLKYFAKRMTWELVK